MDKTDDSGKKLGMWIFLYTEIILFGALFVLYAVYFHNHTNDFIEGGKQLDRIFGTVNTVILLFSSFTVAASITAIRRSEKIKAMLFLSASLLSGAVFLVNKYFEWGHKFEVGIYPNSEILLSGSPGKNIFFGLYYVITGLHGVHIVIGMILLSVCFCMVYIDKINMERFVILENSGLYWHLVDLIWIFVFPLFYLVL